MILKFLRKWLLLSFGLIASCAEDLPRNYSLDEKTVRISPNALGARSFCSGNNQVLTTVETPKIEWSITKTLTKDNKQVPVLGFVDTVGWLVLENKSLRGATAVFEFDPASTDSFDQVRDIRIKEYFFGLSRKLPLNFELSSLTGSKDELPVRSGDSISLDVRGNFSIAGIKVPVQLPVVITKSEQGFRMTQAGGFVLNVRGKPGLNTLGLAQRVAKLMDLVKNVDMLDEVFINFDFEVIDICSI